MTLVTTGFLPIHMQSSLAISVISTQYEISPGNLSEILLTNESSNTEKDAILHIMRQFLPTRHELLFHCVINTRYFLLDIYDFQVFFSFSLRILSLHIQVKTINTAKIVGTLCGL